MIQIRIYNESLENFKDKNERVIFIKKFEQLIDEIFSEIDGYIYFDYVTTYNQFNLKETNIDLNVINIKLKKVNEILKNSII